MLQVNKLLIPKGNLIKLDVSFKILTYEEG